MKKEILKKISDIISNEDDIKEAVELAQKYNITLTEIWTDDEIIGLMIEDETIYF